MARRKQTVDCSNVSRSLLFANINSRPRREKSRASTFVVPLPTISGEVTFWRKRTRRLQGVESAIGPPKPTRIGALPACAKAFELVDALGRLATGFAGMDRIRVGDCQLHRRPRHRQYHRNDFLAPSQKRV